MKTLVYFSLLIMSYCTISISNGQQLTDNYYPDQWRRDDIIRAKNHHCIDSSYLSVNDNYTELLNCKSAQKKWDTIVSFNANGLLHRYTQIFDNQGNVINRSKEKWVSNIWENLSRNIYTYDNKNNLITNISENWQDSMWLKQSKYSYTYDDNQNILSKEYKYWSNNTWINS